MNRPLLPIAAAGLSLLSSFALAGDAIDFYLKRANTILYLADSGLSKPDTARGFEEAMSEAKPSQKAALIRFRRALEKCADQGGRKVIDGVRESFAEADGRLQSCKDDVADKSAEVEAAAYE